MGVVVQSPFPLTFVLSWYRVLDVGREPVEDVVPGQGGLLVLGRQAGEPAGEDKGMLNAVAPCLSLPVCTMGRILPCL